MGWLRGRIESVRGRVRPRCVGIGRWGSGLVVQRRNMKGFAAGTARIHLLLVVRLTTWLQISSSLSLSLSPSHIPC